MKRVIFLLILITGGCTRPRLKKEIIETEKKVEVSTTIQILQINQLTKKIQHINFLVANESYDEAKREIKFLINKYPQNYVFYDMQGSVHYMQGNHELAIESFKNSIRLNPKNKEAKVMLEKSKKQLL